MKGKGELWQIFSHIVEGRILKKPDGTKGVVCCFKYHDFANKFAAVYQVRWEGSRTSVDVPATDVEKWITDVFANETWVPKKIRAAQLANWHEDKVASVIDSPLLKAHRRHHHPEPEPPAKRAKKGQRNLHVLPPEPGENIIDKLHTASHEYAASRRNSRALHKHDGLSDTDEDEEETDTRARREGKEQQQGGLMGQLRGVCGDVCNMLWGGGGSSEGAQGDESEDSSEQEESPSDDAPGTKSRGSPTAAAAAVHMGAATALLAKQSKQATKHANGKHSAGKGKIPGKSSKGALAGDSEEWVPSWTGKVYPRLVCYRPGDKKVQDLTMDDMVGEFVVECIVDEYTTAKAHWFLVKYKGYELRLGNGENDKGDWEPLKNIKGTEAYLKWSKTKPAYYYQGVVNDLKDE